MANLRSAYADMTAALLEWDGTEAGKPADITVTAKQTQDKWISQGDVEKANIGNETYGQIEVAVKKGPSGTWTVSADYSGTEPKVTIS